MSRMIYKDEDLIGKKFGKLTILSIFKKEVGKNKKVRYAHCKCDCGKEKDINLFNITHNKTKSCGCYAREITSKVRTKYADSDVLNHKFGKLTVLNLYNKIVNNKNMRMAHCLCECGNYVDFLINVVCDGREHSCGCVNHGLRNTKLYRTWKAMKRRCYNKNVKFYENYGGRGVMVCDEWKDSFINFYNWAMRNGYKDNLTIDRINVNGDYSPKNCRWVDYHIQGANQRMRKDNPTGFRGVSFNKNEQKYISNLTVNKKKIFFGYFNTSEEAHIARVKYLRDHNLKEYSDYYDEI